MIKRPNNYCALVLAAALAPCAGAFAGDGSDWTYGIGTGLSSFSLDGALGFALPGKGFVTDIDLDNNDTQDMLESAFGLQGIATNGTWSIQASYGTNTLEDATSDIRAEWDRTVADLLVMYNFYRSGKHSLGVGGGVRYTKHDWEISSRNGAFADIQPDEDWTDGLVAASYIYRLSNCLDWRTRVDAGFGDSEDAYLATTGLFWQPDDRWLLNANVRYHTLLVGDSSDHRDSDFYYYNVEETALGVGFMYLW